MGDTDNSKNTSVYYIIRYSSSGGVWYATSPINGQVTRTNAKQHPTLADALANITTLLRDDSMRHSFRILRVTRTVTPGKTARRIVQDGEIVPANAKWAVAEDTSSRPGLLRQDHRHCLDNFTYVLDSAVLFPTPSAALQELAEAKTFGAGIYKNMRLVRIVEETTPDTVDETVTEVE